MFQPHDDFAKDYLTELLSVMGTAKPNKQFKAETRFADLWFELGPNPEVGRSQIGLLGRLLTRDTAIEVFRNPATPFEIRSCQGKLFAAEAELVRQATKQDQTISESDLPLLLLIMPTASAKIRKGFGAIATTTAGVYDFPELDRTILVVVHQLPKTEDTLWLRLLGRAGAQKRAIEEFSTLPTEIPLYDSIGDILADYRAILESKGQLTSEDEEFIMNLSAAYLKKRGEWREEALKEGRQEGRQEERRIVAENLLQQGVSVEIIATATGLSIEEIHQLQPGS